MSSDLNRVVKYKLELAGELTSCKPPWRTSSSKLPLESEAIIFQRDDPLCAAETRWFQPGGVGPGAATITPVRWPSADGAQFRRRVSK